MHSINEIESNDLHGVYGAAMIFGLCSAKGNSVAKDLAAYISVIVSDHVGTYEGLGRLVEMFYQPHGNLH